MPKPPTTAMNAQAAITGKLTPDDPDRSLLLSGLATLADLVQHEVDELRARGVGESSASRDQRRGEASLPQDADEERLKDLQTQAYRIREIYDWVKADAIGQQLREQETKQETKQAQMITDQTRLNYTLAIVTTVVGAILGWLFSLLGTPTSLLHALIH